MIDEKDRKSSKMIEKQMKGYEKPKNSGIMKLSITLLGSAINARRISQ